MAFNMNRVHGMIGSLLVVTVLTLMVVFLRQPQAPLQGQGTGSGNMCVSWTLPCPNGWTWPGEGSNYCYAPAGMACATYGNDGTVLYNGTCAAGSCTPPACAEHPEAKSCNDDCINQGRICQAACPPGNNSCSQACNNTQMQCLNGCLPDCCKQSCRIQHDGEKNMGYVSCISQCGACADYGQAESCEASCASAANTCANGCGGSQSCIAACVLDAQICTQNCPESCCALRCSVQCDGNQTCLTSCMQQCNPASSSGFSSAPNTSSNATSAGNSASAGFSSAPSSRNSSALSSTLPGSSSACSVRSLTPVQCDTPPATCEMPPGKGPLCDQACVDQELACRQRWYQQQSSLRLPAGCYTGPTLEETCTVPRMQCQCNCLFNIDLRLCSLSARSSSRVSVQSSSRSSSRSSSSFPGCPAGTSCMEEVDCFNAGGTMDWSNGVSATQQFCASYAKGNWAGCCKTGSRSSSRSSGRSSSTSSVAQCQSVNDCPPVDDFCSECMKLSGGTCAKLCVRRFAVCTAQGICSVVGTDTYQDPCAQHACPASSGSSRSSAKACLTDLDCPSPSCYVDDSGRQCCPVGRCTSGVCTLVDSCVASSGQSSSVRSVSRSSSQSRLTSDSSGSSSRLSSSLSSRSSSLRSASTGVSRSSGSSQSSRGPSSGSSRSSRVSSDTFPQSSRSSLIVVFNECVGNECVIGGDAYCALQGKSCIPTPGLPCVRCIAHENTAGDISGNPPAYSSASSGGADASTAASSISEGTSMQPSSVSFYGGVSSSAFDGGLEAICVRDADCPPGAQCILNRCLTATQIATLPAFCGNGRIDAGELCDLGASNADIPNALCRTVCLPQRCGDGITDTPLEQCDDGNNVNNDGCSSVCLPERLSPPATQTLPAQVIELPFTQTSSQWSVVSGQYQPNQSNVSNMPHVPSTPDTGPAALAVMLAGGAAGLMWRKRK